MPKYIPWNNGWFQLALAVALFSAVVLVGDMFGFHLPSLRGHTGSMFGGGSSQTQNTQQQDNTQSQQNPQPSDNSQGPSAQAQQYYQQGETAFSNGNYDNAIQNFTQAVALSPNYADALDELGSSYVEESKYDQGIPDMLQALKLDPKNYVTLNNLGWAYNAKGDYNSALPYLNQSIEINSNYTLSYNNRGYTYLYGIRNEAQALEDFTRSFEIDPTHYDSYKMAAWIMATSPRDDLRNGQKALEYINKAGSATGWKDAGMIGVLAAASAEAGDFTNAIKWINRYIATPGLGDADRTVAQRELTLYQQGQPYHRSNQ